LNCNNKFTILPSMIVIRDFSIAHSTIVRARRQQSSKAAESSSTVSPGDLWPSHSIFPTTEDTLFQGKL
jgi:hypothetical protein